MEFVRKVIAYNAIVWTKIVTLCATKYFLITRKTAHKITITTFCEMGHFTTQT